MGNRGPTIRVVTVARKGKKPAAILPETSEAERASPARKMDKRLRGGARLRRAAAVVADEPGYSCCPVFCGTL